MGKPTGPTSVTLRHLIIDLRKLSIKEKTPMWRRLANDLSVSTRRRREVNLHHLDQHTGEKEIAVVPGKVLGHGFVTKKLTVAAFRYSKEAKAHIAKTGKAMTIRELMESNPKGKGVRIIG